MRVDPSYSVKYKLLLVAEVMSSTFKLMWVRILRDPVTPMTSKVVLATKFPDVAVGNADALVMLFVPVGPICVCDNMPMGSRL